MTILSLDQNDPQNDPQQQQQQEQSEEEAYQSPAVRRRNRLTTASLMFNTFAFGISVQIFGATMVDLSRIYGVTQTKMTELYMLNSMGYAMGTLAGLSYRVLNRQLVVALASVTIALTTALLPVYGRLWLAFLAFTAQGIGLGVYGSSYQIWYFEMWPRRQTTVLQVDRFAYGLGCVTAPLLASRFVSDGNNDATVVSVADRVRALAVPFAIVGVVQALAASSQFVLYCLNRYHFIHHHDHPDHSLLTSLLSQQSPPVPHNPRKHGLFNYLESKMIASRRTKLTLAGALLAVYYSAENGYLPYATSMWQYLPVHLSGRQAARVQTALSLAYTVGPLVTAFVSLKLAPDYIIAYHFVILFTGFITVYAGQSSITLIYLGSAALGYGFSAMTPAIFAFVNRHFKLTDKVTAVYLFVSGAVFVLLSCLLVYSPLERDPETLFYLLLGYLSGAVVLFFVIIHLWIPNYGRRIWGSGGGGKQKD